MHANEDIRATTKILTKLVINFATLEKHLHIPINVLAAPGDYPLAYCISYYMHKSADT